MITEKYFVLIIDDHPLITEAYITALNYYSKHNETVNFSIQTAHDCDSGRKLIKKALKSEKHKYIVFFRHEVTTIKGWKNSLRRRFGIAHKRTIAKSNNHSFYHI